MFAFVVKKVDADILYCVSILDLVFGIKFN